MMDVDADPASSLDINTRIAERVRALREELGISLEALSTKCGVSRSMLSLIERAESSPTAVVLEKIATGLGISLAALFDDKAAPPKPISHAGERVSWRDPESGYVRRNISPPNYPSPIQIVDVVMPAGSRVSYETAPDAGIHQQVWVQKGSIELTIGKTTHRLSEDDCLAMQLSEPITFHNRTRKAARYIVVLASPNFRRSP